MKKERGAKVPKRDDIEDELEADADLSAMSAFGQAKSDIAYKDDHRDRAEKIPAENTPAENIPERAAKKAEDKSATKKVSAEEDVFDTTEEERITKNYGKAAGRLARRLKEMDEYDED